MKTISERLASFVFELSYEDLPEDVRKQSKMILYDGLGLILSGYGTEHGNVIHNYVKALQYPPEASIIGYGTKTDRMNAALANGVLCYTHDYSDTVLECVVHCEPVLVPAVLAVGESLKCDGKSALAALVSGYEVMTKVAMAINSGANRMRHQDMGFHPTATCGVFGAAAVTGKLLGHSPQQLVDAFGLAGSMASGILEALTSTPASMTRRIHGGKSAFSGIFSALLAREGFTGPKTVFEGKNGFLRAYTNGHFDKTALESIGDGRYTIMDAAIKYRNCIHAAASAIDLLLEMMDIYGIKHENIDKVAVRIPSAHHRIFSTKKDMYRPMTYGDAQTSLPYCLAVGCLDGEVSVDQFTEEKLRDESVLQLAQRISLTPDDSMDEAFGQGKWPAEIELTSKDGRQWIRSTDYPKGSPQNPLTSKEHRAKFEGLSRAALSKDRREQLSEMIMGLENLSDITSLVSLMVGDRTT